MKKMIILSAYAYITPALFECHQSALNDEKQVIAACLSDSWLARTGHPTTFPEEERARLAEALAGVQQVHIVRCAADLDALQRQYDTHDMVIIDVPTLASVTAPRRLLEYESVPSHRPGYYPPAPA